MKQYIDLVYNILNKGVRKKNRTKIDTKSIFGYQMKIHFKNGFPLLTTKKINFRLIVHELLWFISGSTNTKYLKDHKVNIWNNWEDKDGNLGPIYGYQWRNWPYNNIKFDQITNVINEIVKNPNSRRLIVSSWNVGMIESMALPPCHILFQFYVSNKKLSLQLYQRSADVFIGLPFNISSYSLLLMMICQVTNLKIGYFIHTIGDAHIYYNHIESVKLQIKRIPKKLPTVILNKKIKNIFDFKYNDFILKDYNPYPHIKGLVAI